MHFIIEKWLAAHSHPIDKLFIAKGIKQDQLGNILILPIMFGKMGLFLHLKWGVGQKL